MTTTSAPTPTPAPVTPGHLQNLVNAAAIAGWGDEGIHPGRLDAIAAELYVAAHQLQGMAATARREQAAELDAALVGGR